MRNGPFAHPGSSDAIVALPSRRTPKVLPFFLCVTGVGLLSGVSHGQEARMLHDFGSVHVGMTSKPTKLSYHFNHLATPPLMSISGSSDFVVSQALACGTDGDDCSAWVTFIPHGPGLSQSSIVFTDSWSKEVLAVTPLSGIGVSPQVSVLPGFVSTVIGGGPFSSNRLPPNRGAEQAIVQKPTAIALGPEGDLIISDREGNRVVRYSVKTGIISTIAGTGKSGYSGDGHAATNATLNGPTGVAIDGLGNVYIADTGNNVIRIVDSNNQTISTFAGGGSNYGRDGLGDGGPAKEAVLSSPMALITDRLGELYVADTNDNVIRKVDLNGTISVVAGSSPINTPMFGNDGVGDGVKATSSLLSKPAGLAFDFFETHLYIADTNDNLIRVIDMSTGQMDAVAGTVGVPSGWQGDGGPAIAARLNGPQGLAVDIAGDLYIADTNNHVIRRVDVRSKHITTFAGIGAGGFSSAGLANAVALSRPGSLVMDWLGNLFIADSGNAVVQKVNISDQVYQSSAAVIERKSGSISGRVTIVNTGNADLSLSGSANSPDFLQQPSEKGNACSSSTTLHAGDSCQISADLLPEINGRISDLFTLRTTSNSMQAAQGIAPPRTATVATVNVIAATSNTDSPPTPIVITPGTANPMTEATTQQFEANIPVIWSLAPGSVGSIDPLTGVYTAPASIIAENTVNGCEARPNDDVFNTRVDNLPLSASSANWIAGLGKQGIDYEPAWGVSTFDANTPTDTLKFNYTPQYNGVFPTPVWPQLRKEGGNFAIGYGGGGGDHHYTAVNLSNCQYVDVYNYLPGGLTTSGIKYSGLSWALPSGGTDAAGMELSPLTLHLPEIESGHVDHALRFSMSNNYIAAKFVWPATANAYPNSTNMLPYGSRLRLRANALTVSTHTPMAQTLLNQLLHYGIILADGAQYMSITSDQDVREDPAAWAALQEVIKAVNAAGGMSAFEVVDESSLKVSASSGVVNPANGYVTPSGYAQVIATDIAHPTNTASARILFQGVGIGVPDPAITITSGATVQLQSWTTGTTSNNAVSWQPNPSLGTITSTGLYTAPKVTIPTKTVLTAYSAENPGAAQPVTVTILPLASDGSLRVSDIMGSAYSVAYPGSTLTSSGITWWTDPGFYAAAAYNYCDWGGSGAFNGGWCSFGQDVTHDFLVPNANYKINLYFAVPASFAGRLASWNIGAQGQWTNLGYNVVAASNNGKQLATASLPAQVIDNHLSFTISQANVKVNNGLGAVLSGFSIAPDASGPHLTLSDSSGNTSISIVPTNTTMQFNAVGWYMSNAVTWAISPAIGSISSTGLYTAPITPQTATITLTATSTTKAAQTATMTINLVEGKLAVTGASTLARSLTTQFVSNLNGGAYSNVTWSVSLGSISATGLYTAPDALASNTTATITATSNDDHALTGSFTIKLLANINPIRINSGDWYANVTDAAGNIWLTDRNADVGTTYHAANFDMTGGEIDDGALTLTSPMAPIYNSSRLSSYTPQNQFNYSFRVPNGTYQVMLLFGNYGGTAHSYLFNVSANGTLALSNYDPDSVGFHVSSSQIVFTTVTNQTLTLNFVGIGSKIAEVNGIQIVPLAN